MKTRNPFATIVRRKPAQVIPDKRERKFSRDVRRELRLVARGDLT